MSDLDTSGQLAPQLESQRRSEAVANLLEPQLAVPHEVLVLRHEAVIAWKTPLEVSWVVLHDL